MSTWTKLEESLMLGPPKRKDWSWDETKALRQARRNAEESRLERDKREGERILRNNPDLAALLDGL